MMRTIGAAIALMAGLLAAGPASAEKLDVSTITCQDMTQAMNSKSNDEQYGMSTILYWLAGYNATEDEGTVIYFKSLEQDFANTLEYCSKNPKISVMTAAGKFMGENGTEATGDPVDLSTLKCERLTQTTKDDEEGLGQILMWLAGYHADVNDDQVFDTEAFQEHASEIGAYCKENTQVGFFTTAQKYMTQ